LRKADGEFGAGEKSSKGSKIFEEKTDRCQNYPTKLYLLGHWF
jgi:hypothetical protein